MWKSSNQNKEKSNNYEKKLVSDMDIRKEQWGKQIMQLGIDNT